MCEVWCNCEFVDTERGNGGEGSTYTGVKGEVRLDRGGRGGAREGAPTTPVDIRGGGEGGGRGGGQGEGRQTCGPKHGHQLYTTHRDR